MGNKHSNRKSRPEGLHYFAEAKQTTEELLALDQATSGQYKQAIECYRQTLKIARKLGDKRKEKTLQIWLGDAYYKQEQYKKSLECYELALKNPEAFGDQIDQIQLYEHLTDALHHNKGYQKASACYEYIVDLAYANKNYDDVIKYARKALQTAEALDIYQERRLQQHLGYALYTKKQYEQATECFGEALKIAQHSGNLDHIKQTSYDLGILYRLMGHYEESIAAHQDALEIAEQQKDKVLQKELYENLTISFAHSNQKAKAVQTSRKDMQMDIEYRLQVAKLKESLGDACCSRKEYRKAIPHYLLALRIVRYVAHRRSKKGLQQSSGDLRLQEHLAEPYYQDKQYGDQIRLHGKLADAHYHNRGYQSASVYYKYAVDLAFESENHDAVIKYAKNATECFGEAVKIAQHFGNVDHIKRVKCTLGNLYRLMGHNEMSIAVHQDALAMAKQQEDKVLQKKLYETLTISFARSNQKVKAVETWQEGMKSGMNIVNGLQRKLEEWSGDVCCSEQQYGKAIGHYVRALEKARNVGDKRAERRLQHYLGHVYHKKKQFAKEIECLEQALEIPQKFGNENEERSLQVRLAEAYYHDQQYERSIECYRNVLRIAGEIDDQKHEDRNSDVRLLEFLKKKGDSYYNNGESEEAVGHYHLMLLISNRMQEEDQQKRVYERIGEAYQKSGFYEKSIEYHKKALKIAQQRDDKIQETEMRMKLGNAYSDNGQYQEAVVCYEEALEIVQELGDRKGEREVQEVFADAHNNIGKFEKSIDRCETIRKYQLHQDSLEKLGNIYFDNGEYEKAFEHHQEALKIVQKLGVEDEERKKNELLTDLYVSRGICEKAIIFNEDALRIAQNTGHKDGERRAQQFLGDFYHSQQQFEKAIQSYIKALKIAQELGDEDAERKIDEHLGVVYFDSGQYEMATECIQKSLIVAEKLKMEEGKCKLFKYLGDVYYETEQFQKAVDCYEEVITAQHTTDEERILKRAAHIYVHVQNYEKAIKYCQDVLAIRERNTDRDEDGELHELLGDAFTQKKEYVLATKNYLIALDITEEYDDEEKRGRINRKLGDILFENNDYEKAEKCYKESLTIAERLSDQDGERKLNKALEKIYLKKGESEKAMQSGRKTELIPPEFAAKCAKRKEQQRLGIVHHKAKHYEKAIKCFKKAYDISRELGQREEQRKLSEQLSDVYHSSQQFRKEIEWKTTALKIAQEIGEKDIETRLLDNLGVAYSKTGQQVEAIDCYKDVCMIAQQSGDRCVEGKAHEALGLCYNATGQYIEAIWHHRKAIKIAKEVGNERAEQSRNVNLAISWSNYGNYKRAIHFLQEALTYAQDSHNKSVEGEVLHQLGNVYCNVGQNKAAIDCHLAALKIANELQQETNQFNSLTSLGFTYRKIGQHENGIKFCRKALQTARVIGNKRLEGAAYYYLGLAYCKLAASADVTKFQWEGISIRKERGDVCEAQRTSENLEITYEQIDQSKRTIQHLQNIINVLKKLDDKDGEVRGYCDIGDIYQRTRQYDAAVEFYHTALVIAETVSLTVEATRIHRKLGETYHLNNQHENAIICLKTCIIIAHDIGDREEEEEGYRLLEFFHYDDGQGDMSTTCQQTPSTMIKDSGQRGKLDMVQTAPTTKRSPKDTHVRTKYRYDDDDRKSLKHWGIEKACHFFSRSILAQDEVRRLVAHHDPINTSMSNMFFHRHTYLMNLLLDLNQVNAALLVLDIGKAKALRNLMTNDDKTPSDPTGEESNTRWIKAIADRPSKRKNNDFLDEVSSNIVRSIEGGSILVYGFDNLDVLHIWVISKKGVFHKRHEPCNGLSVTTYLETSIDELRKSMNRRQTGAAFSCNSNVEPEAVHHVDEVPNLFPTSTYFTSIDRSEETRRFKSDFDERVRRISNPTMNLTRTSADLPGFTNCQKIRDIEEIYGLDTPIFTDNKDELLPIQRSGTTIQKEVKNTCARYGLDSSNIALRENNDRPKVDIKEYTNFDCYLSKLYLDLIAPVKECFTGNKLVIVPHGPLFTLPFAALIDSNGVRLCEEYSMQFTPALHTLDLSLARPLRILGPPLFVGNPTVGTVKIGNVLHTPIDLPNAAIEAETCGGYFRTTAVTRKEATKETVLSRMKNAGIIHIAAHGNMDYAEIFLAPNEGAPSPPEIEHFLLMAEDVSKCTLNARLVVLSCCFSGRGQISAEGVVGVARSFLGAGARSVLTTLWQIADDATLEFMKMFYKNVCDGLSVCVALSRTMTTLKEKYSVGDWAAFEILGEDVTFTKDEIEEIQRHSN